MARPKGSRNKKAVKKVVRSDVPIEQPEVAVVAARSRTEEVRTERRRRGGAIDGYRFRLQIPEKFRNDPENKYRWINDDKSRVFDMTKQDDWDQVQADEIEGHDGASSVRRQVGTKANGDPLFAHLVRKSKKFCEEDRAVKRQALMETMDQLAGGKRGDEANLGGGQKGYVSIDASIRDGRRS